MVRKKVKTGTFFGRGIRKQNLNWIYILVLLVYTSCERSDSPSELPPITQSGENTFGCFINQELYVPEIRRVSSSIRIKIEFPEFPNYFFAVKTERRVGSNDNMQDAYVFFNLSNVKETGTYKINYGLVGYEGRSYNTKSDSSGVAIISKIDTIKEVISGTFSFTAINEYDNQIINITDGRFDLKK